MKEDNQNDKLLKHLDDFALKQSTTKIDLTDYDKDKSYEGEESKVNLKTFGVLLGVVGAIVLIGVAVMLLIG